MMPPYVSRRRTSVLFSPAAKTVAVPMGEARVFRNGRAATPVVRDMVQLGVVYILDVLAA